MTLPHRLHPIALGLALLAAVIFGIAVPFLVLYLLWRCA
jgi:hypothetical protein